MADLMAIVAKAVFEAEAGKNPALGSKLGMDRYTSANKVLQRLADGGKLYLVTVRPPNEALWLVGVLEQPKWNGKAWIAKPSTVPITDITELKSKLKFDSGKGIAAAKGALGMSLQTPRTLIAADVALLDGAAASSSEASAEGKPLPPAKSGTAPAGDRQAALLQAIIDDPANLDARRIYADELAMHNDPRGEFIQVDLALAGRLSIRKRAVLAARAQELRKKYGKKWWPYKGQLHTHAGFVESVEGNFETVASTAAELLAHEPASDLRVSILKADLDTIAKSVWMEKVRRLSLRGELGDVGFAELVAIPRLAKLEALNVTAAGIGVGIGKLEGHLPNLTSLVLTANELGTKGLAALVKWRGLPKLERLFLSNCDLADEDIATLANIKFPKLAKLTLSGNPLGTTAATSLAGSAKNFPALEILELQGTEIDDTGAQALAKAKFAKLVKIDLRGTPVETSADARVVYL